MSRSVVVTAGVRTPFVRSGGEFKEVPAWQLGCAVAAEAIAKSELAARDIDDVVFGCVAQPSDTANIARVIALRAGVPKETPAATVGRNCASGMEAVTQAVERIRSGRCDVVLAGGVESMSRIPLEYPLSFSWKMSSWMRARNFGERIAVLTSMRLRDLKPQVALERGLTDPVCGEIMGLTAERLAREFAISREAQDAYAAASHARAIASREATEEEICPFAIPPRMQSLQTTDIGPRERTDKLATMRPYFDRRFGTVTIGNSCGITDGAVALVLAEENYARDRELPILGRIAGHAYRGCEPERMGLGPVHATPPALAEAGIAFGDLSLIELNEAFAAQVIACIEAYESDAFGSELGLSGRVGDVDRELLNAQGGAIAFGHPVGATGARLVLTLLRQLRARGGGFGLATLCIGGGQGGAVVIEGVAA